MNRTLRYSWEQEPYPLSLRGLAALKVRASILSTSQTKRTQFDTAVNMLRVYWFVCLCFIFNVFGGVGMLEIAASQSVYCFNNIL